ELAVRAALGAGKLRLARIPILEATFIAVAATVPALMLSLLALKWAGPAITQPHKVLQDYVASCRVTLLMKCHG
ncbi:MAG: hypothetical protein ABI568_00935, partial [Pseudarthrobacter sp.]